MDCIFSCTVFSSQPAGLPSRSALRLLVLPPPGLNNRFGEIKTVFQISSFFALAEFSLQNGDGDLFYPQAFFNGFNDQFTGVVLILTQIDVFYFVHFKSPETTGGSDIRSPSSELIITPKT